MDPRKLADQPAPIRPGEELDLEKLQAFLQVKFPNRAEASLGYYSFQAGTRT